MPAGSCSGVHVAGSFQGWQAGTARPLEVGADGIYRATVVAQVGTESPVQIPQHWQRAGATDEGVPG